jgi:hypothetical protein
MSDIDPFKSSDEEKAAALERMRALLSQRLSEGEILPMGFSEGSGTAGSQSGDDGLASDNAKHRSAISDPAAGTLGTGSKRGKKTRLAHDLPARPFEWVRRMVRFKPQHSLALDAYCAATGRRHCDVLASILDDFIASEEFRKSLRILRNEGK